MGSSGMLRHVALVRTDVSQELSASIISMTRIGELRTTSVFVFLHSVRWLLVTAAVVRSSPIPLTLMMEALSSSEMPVLTRATWRNIRQDGILHSHCRENLKSYNSVRFVIFPDQCWFTSKLFSNLNMRNSFLKSCRLFLKHPVLCRNVQHRPTFPVLSCPWSAMFSH
jgi:hypothetical protein